VHTNLLGQVNPVYPSAVIKPKQLYFTVNAESDRVVAIGRAGTDQIRGAHRHTVRAHTQSVNLGRVCTVTPFPGKEQGIALNREMGTLIIKKIRRRGGTDMRVPELGETPGRAPAAPAVI
jgi:hypothetical protein